MAMGLKVDNILDDNRCLLPVHKANSTLLALVNKVGAPRGVFPTFPTYWVPTHFGHKDRACFGMQTLALMRNPMRMNVRELWSSPLVVKRHMI